MRYLPQTVYLAARYSRRLEMRQYARDLEQLGIEVVSRWLSGAHDMDELSEEEVLERRAVETFALEDLTDIVLTDGLIAFTEDSLEDIVTRARGGRHVEFGYALAVHGNVAVVGPRENVFHHLPEVSVYDSWEEFLEWLEHQLVNVED